MSVLWNLITHRLLEPVASPVSLGDNNRLACSTSPIGLSAGSSIE